MQAHITREYERLERAARDCSEEAAHEADLARDAERAAEKAYCRRAIAWQGSEEEFELREAEAQAAQYRVTERLNADVLAIFERCAPAWRHDETLSESVERRAA